MQKLSAKLKNIPGNASQVPCSISMALNREETLSVSSIVLTDNSSDENLLVLGSSRTDPKGYLLEKLPIFKQEEVRTI
jgi:hypothetical protein